MFLYQIQNYQAECDLVINNQSQEDIGKQLKILINEINALRGKINDIVTFDQRISNFDEFIKIIEKIKPIYNFKATE